MKWRGAADKPIKRYQPNWLGFMWFSLHDLKKSTLTKCNHLTILWLDDAFSLRPVKADHTSHYTPLPNASEVKLLSIFLCLRVLLLPPLTPNPALTPALNLTPNPAPALTLTPALTPAPNPVLRLRDVPKGSGPGRRADGGCGLS